MTDPNIEGRLALAARYAQDFVLMVKGTWLYIPPQGLIAGGETMNRKAPDGHGSESLVTGADNLHFPMNVGTLLRLGFAGIEAQALASAAAQKDEQAAYLQAVARCHRTAKEYCLSHAAEADRFAGEATAADAPRLRRIADCCRAIGRHAPRTFHQAVQMFWFAWTIRGHGTIGRLDQHLWPFYRDDLAAGRTTREEALDLLCELWRSFNRPGRGDTLRNLMLGGLDAQGHDATNEMSYLMLDAALAVGDAEPHLNVRLHKNTPAAFIDKAMAVQLLGHGQGTVYNDDVVIPSLVAAGVPLAQARNYANDGCSEIIIDGESGIELGMVEAVKSLELALFNGEPNTLPGEAFGKYWHRSEKGRKLVSSCATGFRSGDFTQMKSFDEFYQAFLRQYFFQVDRHLNGLCGAMYHHREQSVASPFVAGTFPQVLAAGVDPCRGGWTVPCWVMFGGSIPTVADCLAAVREVVFERKQCTPARLLEALRADFVGHEAIRLRLMAAPKFGNNIDSVDALAADIAAQMCRRVKAHPTPTGKPIWPALFNHTYNDEAKIVGATPDGRRWKDAICEHYSPTPGRARRGPTAVIRSAAKGPLAEACGTSVFNLSLPRTIFPRTGHSVQLLRHLLAGALKLGVAVMNVAIYDVALLRKAQENPKGHEDLIVRVWGYSARFVDLSTDQQDHIIARTISHEH